MRHRSNKRILLDVSMIFLLFTINFFAIPSLAQQYGEDLYLYQHVDDFENSDNIGFNQSIALNTTLDALELEIGTATIDAYENFTDYTEVDNGNDLTVNETHIEWETMKRSVDNHVHYDFGVNAIHDFNYTFVIQINDIEAGDATGADIGGFACVSTINGSVVDQGADDTIMVRARQEGANDDLFRWYLLFRHNGATIVSIIQALGTNNPMDTYYCRIYRSGTNVSFWAYTDEAMTTLNAKLTSNAGNDADSFQYLTGVASIESGSDPNDHSSGFFWNYWIGNNVTTSAYENDGYAFINAIASGGAHLTQLYNATIPSGDSIVLMFSPDNSTWGLNETLANGMNSIELRNLNYSTVYKRANFTNGGADSTPRLLQLRDIWYNGTAPSGAGVAVGSTAIGFIMLILILAPMVLIIVWKRR